MKQFREIVLKAFLLGLIAVSPVVLYNLIADPYSVFRHDFSRGLKVEPNLRFVKMKYVLSHPLKYDSFLFGSSRVGNIDTTKIGSGRFYNMSYAEGLPPEHLADIRMMLAGGVRIRNLLIGVDEMTYSIDPGIHRNQPMRLAYPGPNGLPLFYLRYVFLGPSLPILQAILSKPRYLSTYDITNSGRIIHKEVDAAIDADPGSHNRDPRFGRPPLRPSFKPRIAASLAEIGQIVDLCRERNIDLKIFVNPIHRTMFQTVDKKDFDEFLTGLARLVPYYNFSGTNEVTTNNMDYYEITHYRPVVGDMIVRTIYGPSAAGPGRTFGTFVPRIK